MSSGSEAKYLSDHPRINDKPSGIISYKKYYQFLTFLATFGAWLINFSWNWGEQRTPGAWKGYPAHPVLFVFAQKPTNFSSQRRVYESFVDSIAQIRSPIHTYTHLVREPFDTLVYLSLKVNSVTGFGEYSQLI